MRYRSPTVFSLGRWSSQLPAGFLVSCGTLVPARCLSVSGTGLLPPLVALSNALPLPIRFAYRWPSTPAFRRKLVWALPCSLAATEGIVFTFFSSGYLDVSVPRVPSSWTMDSSMGDGSLPPPGFPIRTSTDQSLFAAPRGFSQLTTSFVGSWRPGIHPVPLFA